MDTFSSDSIFVKNIYTWGKSSAVLFYRINKTLFVSFFVYRRQSRDCFRIWNKKCQCSLLNQRTLSLVLCICLNFNRCLSKQIIHFCVHSWLVYLYIYVKYVFTKQFHLLFYLMKNTCLRTLPFRYCMSQGYWYYSHFTCSFIDYIIDKCTHVFFIIPSIALHSFHFRAEPHLFRGSRTNWLSMHMTVK